MLRVLGSPARFCDGITRRDALTVGASTLLGAGFTLPNLLASEERRSASGQRPGAAKSVIGSGTVCGASDAQAAYVKDRPVRPADICATVYQQLGIDPDMPVYDKANRPVAVAQGGEPIREIIG